MRTSITPDGQRVTYYPFEVCASIFDQVLEDANQSHVTYVPSSPPDVSSNHGHSGQGDNQYALISSAMEAHDVVFALAQHGCRDITSLVDLTSFCSRPAWSGGFGEVYRARLRDGTPVAVKALRQLVSKQDEVKFKARKRAAREIYSWSKCKHQNVLTLLGMMQHRDYIFMLSPWMEHGTLPSYIQSHPDVDRYKLTVQVAEGLSHMHDIGAVHGDVKGTNVLVSIDGVAMLTDFGNTVLKNYTLQFTKTTTHPGCSARWAAPEVLDEQVLLSAKADVYALGMTILETMSGKHPYSEFGTIPGVIRRVVMGEFPRRPDELILLSIAYSDELWSLLTSCWAWEPTNRPSAVYVRDHLQSMTLGGHQQRT